MKVWYSLLIIVLLIATGCSNSSINSSLSIIGPNNIPPAYIDILESSPIPIYIMDQNDLPVEIKLKTLGKLSGLYVINAKDETFPDEFIFINIDNSPETIVTTFFHEHQHYQCKKTNCRCTRSNSFPKDEQIVFSILREKHALEGELRRSMNLKDPDLVKNVILSISNYILYGKNCVYKMAAVCIYDKELWKEAVIFISDMGEKR
jgi:hypothetical protein